MPRGAPYRAQCRQYPIGSCAARLTDLCGASQAQSRMLKLCMPIPKAKVLLQTPTSTAPLQLPSYRRLIYIAGLLPLGPALRAGAREAGPLGPGLPLIVLARGGHGPA